MIEQVKFFSREKVESIRKFNGKKAGLISISSSDDEPANLQQGWSAILSLVFDDIERLDVVRPEDEYIVFDEEIAKKIVQWIVEHKDRLDFLIVHCNAGISRSGAVAKWVALVLDLPFDDEYDLYNKHVYRTLVRVGGWEVL